MFWLKRNAVHPRARKVDDYGALGRILHFRITSADDVDALVLRLIEEAYAVGAQRTLTPAPATGRSPRTRSRT